MRLDDIILDPELQPRAAIDAALLDEYADAVRTGTVLPPVVVFEHGDQRYLADGFHRVQAACAAGLDDINVDLRPGGRQANRQAALRHSLAANVGHRQRRSSSDYQRAFGIGVAHQLLDEADANAVAATLRCSARWARQLTYLAYEAKQVERDAAILRAKEEDKSNKQIAAEVGMSDMGVSKVLARWNERNPAIGIRPDTAAVPGGKLLAHFQKFAPTSASTKCRRLLCRSRKRRGRFGEPAASGRGGRNRNPTPLWRRPTERQSKKRVALARAIHPVAHSPA